MSINVILLMRSIGDCDGLHAFLKNIKYFFKKVIRFMHNFKILTINNITTIKLIQRCAKNNKCIETLTSALH